MCFTLFALLPKSHISHLKNRIYCSLWSQRRDHPCREEESSTGGDCQLCRSRRDGDVPARPLQEDGSAILHCQEHVQAWKSLQKNLDYLYENYSFAFSSLMIADI